MNKDDEATDEPTESSRDLSVEEEQEDIEMTDVPIEVSEKTEKNKSSKKLQKQHPEGKSYHTLIIADI